ncbi:MAG: XRE family transcriptional regulator [Odoribacter splanchnicus]|nr:XRE family transcriptional regulator [Odoribacter splanchnicus]
MNLQLVKELCKQREMPLLRLAEKIEMSEQNLHRSIKRNKIDAETLEKIAKELQVPINVFFEDDHPTLKLNPIERTKGRFTDSQVKLIELEKENKILKERLRDKQQIIDLLQKQVAQSGDNATCAVAGGQGA